MKNFKVFALLGLLVTGLFTVVTPLGSIWALNTIFSLGIEYSLSTYLASLFIHLFILKK